MSLSTPRLPAHRFDAPPDDLRFDRRWYAALAVGLVLAVVGTLVLVLGLPVDEATGSAPVDDSAAPVPTSTVGA